MKTFKQILAEVQQPRPNSEKVFKSLHTGDDPGYPIEGTEKQFSGDITATKKKRNADKESIAPEDKAVNEETKKDDEKYSKALINVAKKIAKASSGNAAAAYDKIEKLKKGLSKHHEVEATIRLANEGYEY